MFRIKKTKTNRPLVKWLLRASMKYGEICHLNLDRVGVLSGWLYATDGHRAHRIRLDAFGISNVFEGAYQVYQNNGEWLFDLDHVAVFPMQIKQEFSKYLRVPFDLDFADLSLAVSIINKNLPGSEHIDVDFVRDALGGKQAKVVELNANEVAVPVLIHLTDGRQALIMPKG